MSEQRRRFLDKVRSALRGSPLPLADQAALDQMRAAIRQEAERDGVTLDSATWALAGRMAGLMLQELGWPEDTVFRFMRVLLLAGLDSAEDPR